MRKIISPLRGFESPLSAAALSIYAVNNFDPALVFDFDDEYYRTSRAKTTFESAISHNSTTAQNGTMVDSDGLLKWRPHNLLTYSEDLTGAHWTDGPGVTTTNSGDYFTLTADAGSSNHWVYNGSPSGQIIVGIEAKAGTVGWLLISSSGVPTDGAYFDLTNGVKGTEKGSDTASITPLSDGWYYCEVVFASNESFATFCVHTADDQSAFWTALGTETILVRRPRCIRKGLGGMVNNPDRGDSYVPTTDSPRYLPRRGHHVWNGSAFVNEGLLIESEQRTNYIPDSETVETKTVYVTPQEYTLSFNAGTDISSQLSQTIAVTAVDVFVYDTRKDSDGGAWRNGSLAQASSWYNETLNTATRGSRREFPEVAVIVAESNKVTIYDGDDPSLLMWMVFNTANNLLVRATTVSSIAMVNGSLSVGSSNSGFSNLNFIAEECFVKTSAGYAFPIQSISFRNTGQTISTDGSAGIVNSNVNDVAMTVLSGAPTDPTTGLPVPTIAMATDGGVSVIKDDGTVVDSATTLGISRLFFDGLGGIFYKRNTTTGVFWYSTKDDYTAGDGFGDEVARTSVGTNSFDILAYDSLFNNFVPTDDGFASGGTVSPISGLMLHQPNYTDQTKGMSALLTSTYNTGWMNGDIKGAFLSDTDDTDLVGSTLYTSDFSSTTDGWATEGAGSIAAVSSELELTGDGGYNDAARKALTTVVGKRYIIQGKFRRGTGATARVQIQEAFGSFISRDAAETCLLYTSPSPRDRQKARMPSSA